ncbi:glycoside hydrolase family 3 C-terminal domain-containing protein [Alloscardovia omnicolens]|uniref:glycoside hydrolase family 3 protein n=1 Tax=Alloscardovia omnicolens TaxID=419015 RepID=UPI003A7916DE
MVTSHQRHGVLRTSVAVLSTVLALTVGATSGASSYASFISTVIGGTTTQTIDKGNGKKINNGQDNGMSLAEWKKTADSVVQEVASEGITLLKNNNNVLPLSKGSKVTLFGRSSTDLVLGGTGAGTVDPKNAVDLKTAMEEDQRFAVNKAVWDFYSSYAGKKGYVRSNGSYMGALPKDIFVAEPPISEYTDAVRNSYGEFSDAAIVVFSRVGGEGSDMPTGDFGDGTKYLALQPQEKAVLQEIRDSGKFAKTIAVINSSNAMELSWIDSQEYGVDGCLWVGGLGQSGAKALAKVLDGEVNPSGHLVDTYASDSFSSPAMVNFGDFTYKNAKDIAAKIGDANAATKYVVYREGIYVGYRYYETRYADAVTRQSSHARDAAGATQGDSWNYTKEVVYPFGYGLSYGKDNGQPFTQRISQSTFDDSGVHITVTVTNEGNVAGKSVVQLYAQQPYTDGGLEKSAVQLVGFGKTDTLEPGASQEVRIDVKQRDYSTYDALGQKTYVLDAGTYYFAVGNGAHDALNNMLAAQGYNTAQGMDANGDVSKTASWTLDKSTRLDKSASGSTVTNQFDSAGLEHYGKETGYLTRSDWTSFPQAYKDLEASEQMIADLNQSGTYKPDNSGKKAVTGKNANINIAQMVGVDFDDPKWNTFIEQLTVDDLLRIVTQSGQIAVPTIAYPQVFMKDGPAGNNVRKYVEDGTSATGYASEVVTAATFNAKLAEKLGDAMAEDWIRTKTAGAYAPAVNIHRTPYAGRNFEYYSEDGVLSGQIATSQLQTMQKRGLFTFIKHFVLNDQETNRIGVSTFANEQSIREIYLRAFEQTFTEGKTKATMGAFNRIGATWAGAYKPLLKNVVREEWGSTAIIDTDIAINPVLQTLGAGLENGNTMWATSADTIYNVGKQMVKNDNKMILNMQEAAHYILFNISGTIGINGITTTTIVKRVNPYWMNIALGVVAVVALLDVACIVLLVKRTRSGRSAQKGDK